MFSELLESPADPVCIAAGLSPVKKTIVHYSHRTRGCIMLFGILFRVQMAGNVDKTFRKRDCQQLQNIK